MIAAFECPGCGYDTATVATVVNGRGEIIRTIYVCNRCREIDVTAPSTVEEPA